MAVPSSGIITLAKIRQELESNNYAGGAYTSAATQLYLAESGTYGTINGFSSSRPNGSKPSTMSEWYSYDHDASPFGDCMVRGTMILLADGKEVDIRLLEVGNNILTYNFEIEELESSEVLEIVVPLHKDIVEFVFEDGTKVKHTFDHPFYVLDKGWASYKPELTNERYNVEAIQIEVGDYCMNKNKEKVKLVEINEAVELQKTYGIPKLSKGDNFFADGILVHNENR